MSRGLKSNAALTWESAPGRTTASTWNYSLDSWDFTASVAPFCINWAGVLALRAMVTHSLLRAGARPGGRNIPCALDA